jgi:hypothetical protein
MTGSQETCLKGFAIHLRAMGVMVVDNEFSAPLDIRAAQALFFLVSVRSLGSS